MLAEVAAEEKVAEVPRDAAWVGRMLRKRFEYPAYIVRSEVSESTGFDSGRRADALIVSCYPSQGGPALIGVEIKASRGDWMNELKQPDKADAFFRYCDQWYLAVTDKKIVKDGELPSTWGLLTPHGESLKISVAAPKLESEPTPRGLLVSLVRNAFEANEDRQVVEKMKQEEYAKGYKQGKESGTTIEKQNTKRLQHEHENLKSVVLRFERESGVKLDIWGGTQKQGEKFAKLSSILSRREAIDWDNILRNLESVAMAANGAAANVREAISAMGEQA